MASYVGVYDRIYLGPLDLSGVANQVDFGNVQVAMQDSTTFNDGGFACVKPGLISGSGTVKGFSDYTAGVLDDTISIGQIGSQYAFSAVGDPTGTVTAGDTAWFSRGIIEHDTPFAGPVGEMAKFEIGVPFDTAVCKGLVLAPLTTSTATAVGTAVALTGPTAAQKLYAALHVTAFSGFSQVIFTLESDNASNFPSTATRITFTTVTGVTSQFASVAGDFSSETHVRMSWTKTGSGSVTFAAHAAVL